MKNPFRRLLSWWRLRRDYYKCSRCGYSWPKRETKPSGWPDNSHPYGVHLHCPKCGAVVAQYIKSRCLIHAEKYERLEAAVKEMNTPYHSASDFVHTQSDEVMEKYDRWLEEKEIYEEEGKVIRKVKKLR